MIMDYTGDDISRLMQILERFAAISVQIADRIDDIVILIAFLPESMRAIDVQLEKLFIGLNESRP